MNNESPMEHVWSSLQELREMAVAAAQALMEEEVVCPESLDINDCWTVGEAADFGDVVEYSAAVAEELVV